MPQSFFELIDHMNRCADAERARVEELVWGKFGVEMAIMALDMSQFSLGEDLARPGEILISAAARARLAAGFPHALRKQGVSIAGLRLLAYSVRYA